MSRLLDAHIFLSWALNPVPQHGQILIGKRSNFSFCTPLFQPREITPPDKVMSMLQKVQEIPFCQSVSVASPHQSYSVYSNTNMFNDETPFELLLSWPDGCRVSVALARPNYSCTAVNILELGN